MRSLPVGGEARDHEAREDEGGCHEGDERVPPGTWDGIVGTLVGDLRGGRAADGVPRALEEIGRRLAEHFPRQEGDVNELPDALERRP